MPPGDTNTFFVQTSCCLEQSRRITTTLFNFVTYLVVPSNNNISILVENTNLKISRGSGYQNYLRISSQYLTNLGGLWTSILCYQWSTEVLVWKIFCFLFKSIFNVMEFQHENRYPRDATNDMKSIHLSIYIYCILL